MQLNSDFTRTENARAEPGTPQDREEPATVTERSDLPAARARPDDRKPADGTGREVARRGETALPAPATAPGTGVSIPATPAAAAPRKSGTRRKVLLTILTLALLGGGYEGYHWWTVGRFELATDDAYLASDMSIISAKIPGYVASVEVAENQEVKRGDVIARIDDGDYRLAVQAAEDKLAMQKSTIERIGVQVDAARTHIVEVKADVASAAASLDLANSEFERKSKLVKNDFASAQALDTARADRDRAIAALAGANAAVASAEADVTVLEAERAEAQQTIASLRTAVAQAERDLSFTAVRAPVDGVVGNKAVEVGELVQAGTRLAAIVPLDTVYVDANFKETQLETMLPGQHADVSVDAFPGRVFDAQVESIAPASGALFSLLPPENATGNFTKIVQRLPVRLSLSPSAREEHVLRPGMSVVVKVDIRTGPVAEAAAAEAAARDAATAEAATTAGAAAVAEADEPAVRTGRRH